MRRRHLLALGLVFLAGVGAGVLLTLSGWAGWHLFSAARSGEEGCYFVTVEASRGWTETGIRLEAGDFLSVHYLAGEWSPWPGGLYGPLGAGGDPDCGCNVMRGVSHAALIGRIGENPPFLVGRSFGRVVGESGVLYLGINDVDVGDNAGSLEVEVLVVREYAKEKSGGLR